MPYSNVSYKSCIGQKLNATHFYWKNIVFLILIELHVFCFKLIYYIVDLWRIIELSFYQLCVLIVLHAIKVCIFRILSFLSLMYNRLGISNVLPHQLLFGFIYSIVFIFVSCVYHCSDALI